MIKIIANVLRQDKAEIAVDENRTLLDQCEDAEVLLPYGCRAGSCGSCRVQIDDGADLLAPPGPVERDTLGRCRDKDNIRLACRAKFKASGISGNMKLVKAPEVPPLPGEDFNA